MLTGSSQTRSSSTLLVRKNGTVYTPDGLSEYLAQKMLGYVFEDSTFSLHDTLSVTDHACGDGILLQSIGILLSKHIQLNHITLCGIDIDSRALESCRQRFSQPSMNEAHVVLIPTNALRPYDEDSLLDGWQKIFEESSVSARGFDLLISNPPWGADISDYRHRLDASQFMTLHGQVDTFELFVELAMKFVRPGGYFAFIVPDSILNHGKSRLRELLLQRTEMRFVARLGEKIFPRINRGCALIICKNTLPTGKNLVDCFRLSNRDRAMLLERKLAYSEAEYGKAHRVPQARFATNPYKQFDVDAKGNDTILLDKLRRGSKNLADVLVSTRGVELGSSGMICLCKRCSTWSPISKKARAICKTCGAKYNSSKAKRMSIISNQALHHSLVLITGGDLKRYSCTPSHWIVPGKKGINYKSESTFAPPKILVRKTGVGLTAVLDYTFAYTNQVVYILRKRSDSSPDLEFFVALLNSRVYFFILAKSFGELEWRSHPYLTQSQILSLPLPDLESVANRETTSRIISLLRPVLQRGKPTKELDLEIELSIAKLFSLTRSDFETIYSTINESQELIPVRDLKNLEFTDIFARLEP